MTALELGRQIKAGNLSAVEAVASVLQTIEEKENSLHCYINIVKEDSVRRAKVIQKKIENGEFKDSLLAGVPFAVKDNICTRGLATTCGSRMLADFVPSYSATVVERLEAAGAILIGKTNMDEFAMGNSSETSYYGATKNPSNPDYCAGGSSGGSAAAVAAGEAFFCLGSDTGGSIRQPASFCGVTGIKPTYGMVSRYGLIAYASSFDQIGPIGRDVSDCAAVLAVIAGHDPKDAVSSTRFSSFSEEFKDNRKNLRIAVLKHDCGACESVRKAVDQMIDALRQDGAAIDEITPGLEEYIVPAYYVLASSEASSNLARYDGIRYGYREPGQEILSDVYKKSRSNGFGMEVKRRITMGTFVLSSENYENGYQKAQKVRMKIKQTYDDIFRKYDVLLGAATPHTAYRLLQDERNPWERYTEDRYTAAANLAGFPAMSIPCGIDEKGLPIGLSVIGKPFGENDMLTIAYACEQIRKGEKTQNATL